MEKDHGIKTGFVIKIKKKDGKEITIYTNKNKGDKDDKTRNN